MLYIVYVAMDEDRVDEWLDWMRTTHVPDVLETGCFEEATIARDAAADGDGRAGFRFVYRAPDRVAFDRYQREFAADLQEDHTSRFEGSFEASRDILPVIENLQAGVVS